MAKERENGLSSGIVCNSLTYGSKIIGKVIADKDFRIDGEIEGDITCNGKIVIGQNGLLKGNAQCTNAEVLGKIEGKIEVTETLSLRETAHISGEVYTKILVVEPKAILNGTCSMGKSETTNTVNSYE